MTETDFQEEEFLRDTQESEIKKLDLSINQKREDTRSRIANRLIWLLIGTNIIILTYPMIVFFLNRDKIDEIYEYSKDIFSLLVTTQTGLIGAVIGFYFGSNQLENSN